MVHSNYSTSNSEALTWVLFAIITLIAMPFIWYFKMTLNMNDLLKKENYQYYQVIQKLKGEKISLNNRDIEIEAENERLKKENQEIKLDYYNLEDEIKNKSLDLKEKSKEWENKIKEWNNEINNIKNQLSVKK